MKRQKSARGQGRKHKIYAFSRADFCLLLFQNYFKLNYSEDFNREDFLLLSGSSLPF
jgi:phage regulator Rha-like protein